MKAKQYLILFLLLAGCGAKEPEDVNELVWTDANEIVCEIVWGEPFDYNDYIVEPSTELLSFSEASDKVVVFYVDSNGLIAIRYENCTPKEGAKIVDRLLKMYFGRINILWENRVQ